MKQKIVFFSILIFLSLLMPSKIQAITYYVSIDGNNHDGTSWTTAWNELDQINWNIIQPGDVIEIDGGLSSMVYNKTLVVGKSGENGNPIIITNSQSLNHNGKPIINDGILITYKQNVIVKNLTVKKSTGDAVYFNHSQFITIDSCIVEHPGGRGIMGSGWGNYDNNNNTIKNCYIDSTENTNYIQEDNIYMQYGNNVIIEGNTIINRNKWVGTDEPPHIDLIQTYFMDNIIIRNNYLEFTPNSGNNKSQVSMIEAYNGFVKVYNNVILTCPLSQWNGFYIGQEDTGGAEIYIWNNTIKAQHPNGTALRLRNTDPKSIKAIKNNILIAGINGYYAIFADNGIADPSVVDYNILDNNGYNYVAIAGNSMSWSQWQAAGFDTHGYNIDPNLNNNLMPDEENDPPIDKGTSMPEFSTDRVGITRPQGSAWDIGAYEYLGSQTCPADLNGDGEVNHLDLKQILNKWGQTCSTCPEDLEKDGKINVLDLAVAIKDWGLCE